MKASVRIEDVENGVVIITIPEWSPTARIAAMQLAVYGLTQCKDIRPREGVVNPISVEEGATDDDGNGIETALKLDVHPDDIPRLVKALEEGIELHFLTLPLTANQARRLEEYVNDVNTELVEATAWRCRGSGCTWTTESAVRPEGCPECGSGEIQCTNRCTLWTPVTWALDTVLEELDAISSASS